MKLIAVISHKGGAGKTTSAVQIAEELARRGQRTLLVDADRQQGAGLLLGIDAPAGCVQRTTVPQLDYLGSARLTDLEIADCYAGVADRFDVGVVDTPSLDDALARAWLREAAAALMVLQVDPLTVKTLPSALNTLEMVRAFQPSIQILGLLPTMFDPAEEVHGRLLAELLSRRPEAVFTPVVPADPGLMHRANAEECPPVGEAARQAYQCAVDRILRALESAAPGVSQPRPAPAAPRFVQAQPLPPGAAARAPSAPPVRSEPRRWQETPEEAVPARREGRAARREEGMPEASDQRSAASDRRPTPDTRYPVPDSTDVALEALASHRVEEPRRKRPAENTVPDWWPRQQVRVDETGVVRRPESWVVRSRFAIACTVACLALIAAVVMGTARRVPVGTAERQGGSVWSRHLPAAMAVTHAERRPAPRAGDRIATPAATRTHKKSSTRKHTHHSGPASRSGGHLGNQ